MKKIFLFAAAVVAAMTVKADVLDLTTAGATIEAWTVANATQNATETKAAEGKYVYDIKAEELAESYITAVPQVLFQIKNKADKQKAFVIYPGKCYEYGGKNGILVIKGTKPGAQIELTVAAKGEKAAGDFKDPESVYPKQAVAVSTDLVLPVKDKSKAGKDGYDEQGYCWKTIVYQSLGGDVEIKEFGGGYRINKIVFEAGQGVENVFDNAKAVKTFENGQLVIIKNGVRYNALGAAL